VATGYPQSKASWRGSCTARMPQECCTGVIALTLKLLKLTYCCLCSFPSRADLKQQTGIMLELQSRWLVLALEPW